MESTIELAASVAGAFLTHNSTRAEDVPQLIATIHGALIGLGQQEEIAPEKPIPAVNLHWKKTIHRDYLISLVDGHQYQTLRRHLTAAGYTAEGYREAFDLPPDYPMVATGYSEKRSALAKSLGLGNSRAKSKSIPSDTSSMPAKPKRSRKAAKS